MSSTDAPPGSADSKAAPKQRKRRNWRRIFIVGLVSVIVLAVIGRVIIAVAFPAVLRKVAAAYDLDASYSRMEMYLLAGDVGLFNLTITPKSGGKPLMSAEYARGDVSTLNLLRGKLVVHRAELDGMKIDVQREADGSIPAIEKLLTATVAAEPKPGGQPTELSLDPPLQVDAVRVNRLRAHWVDRSVLPPVDTEFEVTLRLSDLGVPDRPTHLLVEGTSPPLLDTLRIEGIARPQHGSLDANFDVLVRGIHPKPAAGYLAPLGIRPVGDSITLNASTQVKLHTIDTGAKQPVRVAGNVTFNRITAITDTQESAGVDSIAIDIDSLSANGVRIGKSKIDGVRANARRTSAGNVRFAGLELTTAAPSTQPVSNPSGNAPATQPNRTPLVLALGELSITNVHATFGDDALVPTASLAFVVDQLTISGIDSAQPDSAANVIGEFSAPGIARSIQLRGTARPFAATRTLDAKLIAQGIKPDAIHPYLESMGLESAITDGTFTCDLNAAVSIAPDGAIRADAKLADIKLTDAAGGELVAFDEATISNVSLDAKGSAIRVNSIDLAGPRLAVRRSNDGAINAFGLRTRSSTPANARDDRAPADQQPPATASPVVLPRLELGRLTWKGVDVQLADDAVAPPSRVRIQNAGVELADIVIDLDANAQAAAPGKIRAWMVAPGIAEDLQVSGTVTPAAGRVTADLNVVGKGLRGALLSPYLSSLGIEPTLRDGSLQMHANVLLAQHADHSIGASLAVESLRYADGEQELIALDRFAVDDVVLKPDGLAITSVQIDKPHATAQRNADGSLAIAGVRINLPTTQPTTQPLAHASPAPAATGPVAESSPFVATLGKLRVNDAALSWVDQAVHPAVSTTGRASVEIDQFVFGRDAAPAVLKIVANLAETLENVTIAGQISPSLAAPMVKLDIVGHGLREGVLASYLPPGVKIALNGGRFRAKLQAGVAVNPQGGNRANLDVTEVDYRDGEGGEPLLAFESARVAVSRVDVPGKVIAIDDVSLNGFETRAVKASDGSINLLGLKLVPVDAKSQAPVEAPIAAASGTPATQPAGSTDVNALIAAGRETLPLITLEKLAVNIRRASFVDESRAGSAPIALADVTLSNRSKIELLGDAPQSRPPVELQAIGKIQPVVGAFDLSLQLAPFASQPSMQVKLAVSGISGAGLTAIVPEVREQIDGSQLSDGRFTTSIEATAKVARRGPAQLDFTKPMEVTAVVRNVAFRADGSEGSPILAGVEEVRADSVRIDPNTGSVIARAIDITRPIARATREADGIHALGLLIKLPAAKSESPAAPERASAAPPAPAPSPKPNAEIAIEKLAISGLDVVVQDNAVSPPTVVPLTSLEADVRGLSNLALFETRPIRFNITAGAGKVPLRQDKPPREVFSEVAASGNVSLYPSLRGWARSTVSGFELVAVKGEAAAQNVTIENGVMDSRVDVRFQDDGSMDTRSRIAFTDLRMSEPDDGLLRRVLKLPAPLDATIMVLEDADGAITVPLGIKVEQNNVSGGQIAGAAIGAFGSIVATAVANAPVKAVGSVTELVGLDRAIPFLGKKRPTGPQDAGALDYFAGADESAGASANVTLKLVIDQMRKDKTLELSLKHELGGGDIARAAQRANPSADEAAALGAYLRQRRAELLQSREQIASVARATIVASADRKAAGLASEKARDIESQIAATEDALDRVFELTRPGAERQADRRTRAASLEIAEARLNAIKTLIIASGVPDAENRVKVTKPQFTQVEGNEGGKVTMVMTSKKKP